MKRKLTPTPKLRKLPAFTAALLAAGLLTEARAQVQTAGTLFVNVDATSLPLGPVTSVPNAGTLGGVFATTADPTNSPVVVTIGGTKAMQFDGNDFLQALTAVGGSPILAPAELTGENPTRSIEVWALNPQLAGEETLVSWGRRGGSPDGSNMSFNYGSDFRWGAVGHWGNRDLGWDSNGGGPAANKWHHLVYTFDGTTTRVYSDGVIWNGEFLGGDGVVNTHADTLILIGAQSEGADGMIVTPGLRFSGGIARVRIHDGVLTPQQILNNYNAEKAAFVDPTVTPEPTIDPARLSKAPIHRYSFSEAAGDASNKQFLDSVGTSHGMVLGEGGTFTGSRLTLPGGSSQTQAYGDLPNGLLSSHGVANGGTGAFSFETWVKVTGGRTWSRVFDFGSSGNADSTEEVLGPGGGGEGRDYFMYSAQVDGDVNNRRLEVRNEDPAGGGIVTVDNATRTFNSDAHLLFTWDEATGRITAYENGRQVSTMVTDDKMSDINDVNVWLGRSNWTGDQNAQAEFDEVRVYDYVLSAGQALGNTGAGPDLLNDRDIAAVISLQPQSVSAPETSSATFRVDARGSSPLSIQWLRNGQEIPGATSPSYTIASVTGADAGATFQARVSNVVNGAPVTVTSAPATLTVLTPTVTLKHRYSFNETSGTVAADSVGSKNGTVMGTVTMEGGQMGLDGVDSYIDLPNGIISGLGQDGTIELWLTHQGNSTWSRIFDFGVSDAGEDAAGGGVDFLFLTPRTGDGFPRFTANFPGGGDLVNLIPGPPAYLPANEQRHFVITWSASGNTSRLFVDGVAVDSGTAPQPLSNMAGSDVNNWLGRSQFVADANWLGKYNELRLHSGAMTPSQVQASYAAGPDQLPVAAPNVAVRRSGANVIISWPASATGFNPESTGALGPGATWTSVSGATANGANMEVSVPIQAGARFFRLKR